MSKVIAGAAAALALGLGLSFTTPSASAQQSSPAQGIAATEGAQILNRARGGGVRVGGGGYRGGPRYYGGGRHYRGGRNYGAYVAGGVAAAIVGGVIANEVYRPRYYGGGLSCGELEARCDSGQGWACRRLDNDPRC